MQTIPKTALKDRKTATTEVKDPVARIFDSIGILTAESKSISSRDWKEPKAHLRFIAVYAEEGEAIRLVHFQSTTLS